MVLWINIFPNVFEFIFNKTKQNFFTIAQMLLFSSSTLFIIFLSLKSGNI